MPRILKAYPRESFTFSSYFVRAVFPISPDALALEQEVSEKGTGKKFRKEVQERNSGKTRQNILNSMIDNPSITVRVLAEKLNISERAVNKQISALREQNRIKRVGGRKFGQWEVITNE
jgi:predicted HTH transcriptional regulator